MAANKDQVRRFEEAAREAGCDETGETFERVFKAIVPPKRRPADASKKKPDHNGRASKRSDAC